MTGGEDCPNETNDKIKTIHNGEQGQRGPSSATPASPIFTNFHSAPQSPCYVHAKTKRIWVLHDFILFPLLERIHRHLVLVPSEGSWARGNRIADRMAVVDVLF